MPLIAWLAMVILLFSLPIAFCGYESGDRDTIYWYYLSESGGVFGTGILVTVLCLFFASFRSGWKKKTRSFAGSLGFFALVLGGIAFVNENALKPFLQKPRPSHKFLLQAGVQDTSLLTKYYQNEVEQRRAYLRVFIQQNPEKVKAISPRVLNHWVEEAGYSFPSGHSQNAFLLATILVFWLWGVLPRRQQYWMALPVTWAVMVCLSRVALGVHTETDVAFGAAFGLVFAYILSFTGLLNRLYGTLPNHIP
ncbi:MAG: phosphatase PAP2 family protein [Adhaeribacter sp.]